MPLTIRSRVYWILLLSAGIGGLSVAQDAPTTSPAPVAVPALAIVGFVAPADMDPRDTWIPTALEELSAEQLRYVPGLVTVPTVRVYQARAELQGPDPNAPPWLAVLRGLGATHWVAGECKGLPHDLTVTLTLRRLDQPDEPLGQTTLPAGRFEEVLAGTNEWIIAQLRVPLDAKQRTQLRTAPSGSRSAMEYYARALAALRGNQLRDALRHTDEALAADGRFRSALALLAQLQLQVGQAHAALGSFRALDHLSELSGDALDRIRATLGQALALQVDGEFDAARTQGTTALQQAYYANDPYAQIAALNVMADLDLTRRLPADVATRPAEEQRNAANANLKQATEWLETLVDVLRARHDSVALLPALSKLALIYERLGDLDRALATHQQSLELARSLGSRPHEATAWMYLGQSRRQRKELPQAEEALKRCLELADDTAKPNVRLLMGELYIEGGRAADAIAELEPTCAALQQNKDLLSQCACLQQLARAQRETGHEAVALKTLQAAIDVAHALRIPDEETLKKRLSEWQSEKR